MEFIVWWKRWTYIQLFYCMYQMCLNKDSLKNKKQKLLDNLDKMDKFLEAYSLPKLNQKESENLNTSIETSEIEG